MRSTLTFPMTAEAWRMARSASSAPWRRPSFASTPGSNDCTPMETRFTPASRQAASRAGSQDSGFTSSVISSAAGRRTGRAAAAITSATSAGSQSDGVPPPR